LPNASARECRAACSTGVVELQPRHRGDLRRHLRLAKSVQTRGQRIAGGWQLGGRGRPGGGRIVRFPNTVQAELIVVGHKHLETWAARWWIFGVLFVNGWISLMAEKNIRALGVVEHGTIVGLVSERDYVRKLVLVARSPQDTLLGDIMSTPVMYVRLHQTSDECMALMTQNRLRHVPVIDGGQLIGLISIGDLVKATISERLAA
jgi:hypothetical protein